jgi:hypothetical protein
MTVGDLIKNLANVPDGAQVFAYISRDNVLSVRAEWSALETGPMKRPKVATIVQAQVEHQVVVV